MISERDVIYITKKQASIAVVALAIFCTLMFMLGYFWGKQSILEGFGQRITQESMNDQADYESMMQLLVDKTKTEAPCDQFSDENSMSSQLASSNKFEQNVQDHFEATLENSVSAKDQKSDSAETSSKREVQKNCPAKTSSLKNQNKATSIQSPKKWSATLVGFATKQHALSFVQRLHNRGINVHIKTKISKTATGKTQKMWFQVVTSQFNSKEELDEEIAQIKKTERIKSSDIKII